MPELYDGSVIPSYLTPGRNPLSGSSGSLSDTTLRLGEVVAAYSPGDIKNVGEYQNKCWVYVVNVSYRNGSGARSIVPYRCTVSDLFGGIADHVRYTVRKTDAETAGFSKGSQVLVLCVNGDKSQGYIVGGVRHSKDETSDPNDTFLDFLFNGVNAKIDKDGALSVVVPGATNIDGNANNRDPNNHGSTVTFGKDGTIVVSDNNGDAVTINPQDKKISITAGDQTSTIQKKWKLSAATVEVTANEVMVKSDKIGLGNSFGNIGSTDGVVIGSGVDPFTGLNYRTLSSTSKKVRAKK